jgi:BMFP domain-containing protein YqiC
MLCSAEQLTKLAGSDSMTQTTNPILDQFAKLMTDAAGAAQGASREVQSMVRSQGERVLREFDVVQREEFEAVKAMAEKARAENTALEARLARLEALFAAGPPATGV